eukprot:gnl/Dysnectes_brevis/725_a798_3477.p1 GENE.gnl/Dysnectes_brevis/725_a798_3477~~gnl/Dysnectes_brevis/725_a798_3477.p1  ORF type:complete len:196 (+),score=53.61 gnl/Dysnectes_brevis/725_a798_3477:47-634(+)
MGISLGKVLAKWFGKRESRIVMLGLDAAGKTTILHKMAFDEVIETVPTVGFTLQTVKVGRLVNTCWDIGGQTDMRHLWRHYYKNSDGIIYVVDSAEHSPARKTESQAALEGVLSSPDLEGVPLLVLANKQDIEGAATQADIAQFLGLGEVRGHQWKVMETCALTGQGLMEGMKWLSGAMQARWDSMDKAGQSDRD